MAIPFQFGIPHLDGVRSLSNLAIKFGNLNHQGHEGSLRNLSGETPFGLLASFAVHSFLASTDEVVPFCTSRTIFMLSYKGGTL